MAGAKGQVYTLRVKNLSPSRIEVINTVDGRHTLKDEEGDAMANRGLIFNAGIEGEFTGWRLDNDRTREFVFGSPDRSVAVQATGSDSNVGVIGFAAYRERQRDAFYARYMGVAGAAAYSANAGDSITRGLGTGMGETRHDHIGTTTFDRAGGLPDILTIGYDTLPNLTVRGIATPIEPNAFPGSARTGTTGYERY